MIFLARLPFLDKISKYTLAAFIVHWMIARAQWALSRSDAIFLWRVCSFVPFIAFDTSIRSHAVVLGNYYIVGNADMDNFF